MALAYDVLSIRDPMLNLITSRAEGSALLRIYDAPRPATAGAATTLLAELVCNPTFAAAASAGVLTAGAISSDTSANATGTASWFRIVQSDGTTFVMDGDITDDLILDSTSVIAGATVSVTGFTIQEGNP